MENQKRRMDEQIFRVEDYGKLKELHQKIIDLINFYKVSGYNAIGVLETIKQEIFSEEEEG